MTELQPPSTTDPQPQRGQSALIWLGGASVSVAVVAWLALVLDYQYRVAWLDDYVISVDALFLAGLAGILLTLSVQRWGATRVEGIALRLALSIAVLVGALFVAEVAARYTVRGWVPDVRPTLSHNSLGFREREIGPKNAHRYRIAVIGDSFTWGNGVELQDRFSNLIQGFLGPEYEVLNFGMPGNNLPEHLDVLDVALKVQPDFVLLQLYENDFETPEMYARRPRSYPLLPPNLDTRLGKESLIYRLLLDHWYQLQERVGFAESYTAFMTRHLMDPQTSDSLRTSAMLVEFIDRTRKAGVSNGGVLFPALYALASHGESYPFRYLNDRVEQIYFDQKSPYLDLLPAFLTARDPPSLWVSRFDPHPNAKANRLAATAILNKFLPVWRH